MKQLSIFIIILLTAVLGTFFGAAHFHVEDDSCFAGPVRVPVYVPGEPVVTESANEVLPLRHSSLLPMCNGSLSQVQAPSVQSAKTTFTNCNWTLLTTSQAHTSSVGGGTQVSSDNMVGWSASANVVPTVGNAIAYMPSAVPYRQTIASPIAHVQTTDNPMQRRRAAQATGTFNPADESTWPTDPDIYDVVTGVDGKEYWWNGITWVERPSIVDPTPVGNAPWLLLLVCLLLYGWRKRRDVCITPKSK